MAKFISLMVAGAALTGFIVGLAAVALAHGGPEITATPPAVAHGLSIKVKGEDINPQGEITVTLEGSSFRGELGRVKGDSDGGFESEFILHKDIPPGSYLVRAIGTNGKWASVEITVEKAKEEIVETEERVEGKMASAEEHQLPRPKSARGNIGGIVFSAVSFILGFVLVRPKLKRSSTVLD